MKKEILVSCQEVKKYYPLRKGVLSRTYAYVKAVDGVSLDIQRGETFGLVGESGCGKSTFGRILLRLEEPSEGQILFEGRSILRYRKSEMQRLRREMQIIFQDPYSSLNPRKKVISLLGESFLVHKLGSKREMRERVEKLLEIVGIRPEGINHYPHEFSGGQRQRIGIARALILNPKFMVCDEPVSALDTSIQAQILNLLLDLQERFGLAYLFISHDLNVMKHVSDRIAVMYLGQIVECAATESLYINPRHPYTEALLSATPQPNPLFRERRIILEGTVPSPINPPEGCRFNTRCPKVFDMCRRRTPQLRELEEGHLVRCFLYGDN